MKWSNIKDPRFVPTPALIAKLITQLTECLFQAPYQIDIWDVLKDEDPERRVQGPWYSTNPVMMDLLTSNNDLGGSLLDKRELELRNKVNWRNWSEMLTILFVANSAFAPKVFPKI